MRRQQKFAIAIPSLNQGATLDKCLNSIASSTPVEVFVADGGSTDNTLDVLKRRNGSVRWISERDKGQADALNKAFSKLDGEIMGYMNCDDGYLPGALDAVAKIFEDNNIHVVAGWAQNITQRGYSNTWGPTEETWRDISWLPIAFEPATFWRRKVWETEGPFRIDLHYVFGWEFLCKASKNYNTQTIQRPLSFNGFNPNRKTVTGGERRREEILNLVRRNAARENMQKYNAVLAAGDYRMRLCADFRPARFRPKIYRALLPDLAHNLSCSEALHIYRVLRGW